MEAKVGEAVTRMSWAVSMLGLPATPFPLVTTREADPATMVRSAQVSAAVWAARPVPASASTAARSLAKTRVGFPACPSPLVTVIPAAGAVRVRRA